MLIWTFAFSRLLTSCQVGFCSYGVGDGKYDGISTLTVLPVPGGSVIALNEAVGYVS